MADDKGSSPSSDGTSMTSDQKVQQMLTQIKTIKEAKEQKTGKEGSDVQEKNAEPAASYYVSEEVFEKVEGYEAVLDLLNNLSNKLIFLCNGKE